MATHSRGRAPLVKALTKALGHSINNQTLLLEAMTHPSCEGERNYQRLEFLGDRVLSLVVGKLLYEQFPSENEGELSRRQASLVKRDALSVIAKKLKIGTHILMTPAVERNGGRENPSILGDVLEALIATLYLEHGLDAVDIFVKKNWGSLLKQATFAKDSKSALQEWAQGRGLALPTYHLLTQKGSPHAPRFIIEVAVESLGRAQGEGTSKQEAEIAAASALLLRVKKTAHSLL